MKPQPTEAEDLQILNSAVSAHCAACITNGSGRVLNGNPAFLRVTGHSAQSLHGRAFTEILAAEPTSNSLSEVWDQVSAGKVWNGRIMTRTTEGTQTRMEVTIVPHIAALPEDTRCVILLSDATYVDDLERKLAQANNELAEMGKIQSNFLAAMSHDLRTPLNSIIGFTDIIKEELFGPIGNQRYADYLASVNGSAKHLLTLVNDILDFSIMEATGYRFQLERYDPVEQTKTVARTFDWIRREKSLRIEVVGGRRAPETVLADPRIATQIQTNLLTNACRHSPYGGRVSVIWDRDDHGGVFLEISNEGDPIPDEIIEGFGRPFLVRNPMHASNTEKSYGLGLYICHRFIEARGGKLDISRNNGIGAVVRATWPAEVLKPEPA